MNQVLAGEVLVQNSVMINSIDSDLFGHNHPIRQGICGHQFDHGPDFGHFTQDGLSGSARIGAHRRGSHGSRRIGADRRIPDRIGVHLHLPVRIGAGQSGSRPIVRSAAAPSAAPRYPGGRARAAAGIRPPGRSRVPHSPAGAGSSAASSCRAATRAPCSGSYAVRVPPQPGAAFPVAAAGADRPADRWDVRPEHPGKKRGMRRPFRSPTEQRRAAQDGPDAVMSPRGGVARGAPAVDHTHCHRETLAVPLTVHCRHIALRRPDRWRSRTGPHRGQLHNRHHFATTWTQKRSWAHRSERTAPRPSVRAGAPPAPVGVSPGPQEPLPPGRRHRRPRLSTPSLA